MRVLLIKTSSLGDVIHTLPAVTDAQRAIPEVRFHWVVEEAFAEIPGWHPAVEQVIPVALRRWRRHPLRARRSGEWATFRGRLAEQDHDLVVDAQGLLKSAWLTRYVDAPVHGPDRHSARERLASRFYDHRHAVDPELHAVERTRRLFAAALGYAPEYARQDYGLDSGRFARKTDGPAPVVFFHGTTWRTKHWPEAYWRELACRVAQAGYPVRIPWGNDVERARAGRIASELKGVEVLPPMDLAGLARVLAAARGCVAVDTGPGHLAAALGVPTVSLFGPTSPGRTGAWGPEQIHLASDFPCAPCFSRTCRYRPTRADRRHHDLEAEHPLCFTRLPPARVWENLRRMLEGANR